MSLSRGDALHQGVVLLVLACLLTLPASCSTDISGRQVNPECAPYVGENECATYLSGSLTPRRGAPEQLIYDSCLGQAISSLRMVIGLDPVLQCRRYIISLLCHAVFPPCTEAPRQQYEHHQTGIRQECDGDCGNKTFQVELFCNSTIVEGLETCRRAESILSGKGRQTSTQ